MGTFGYLDRETLQWRDPALFAVIKSSWTTRPGSTSVDKVFVPKSSPVTAKSLTLNLNGTSFRGLWRGGTKLAAGRDYTVSGSRLTFTAKALTRLVGTRAYGVNATLQARFSRGLPWNIDIVTNDAATVSTPPAPPTRSPFPPSTGVTTWRPCTPRTPTAPTPGPTDWTPYQEFNRAFSPDGDTATLVFHFHSGATVTYHVRRSPADRGRRPHRRTPRYTPLLRTGSHVSPLGPRQ
ncbi:X2-like carbohydrate binding domain-containing protein [Streptomyces sviceus]